MDTEEDNQSFRMETSVRISNEDKLDGKMTSKGADAAGMVKAKGVNSFYRRLGIAVVIVALALLLGGTALIIGSLAPEGVIKPLAAQHLYSPASIQKDHAIPELSRSKPK